MSALAWIVGAVFIVNGMLLNTQGATWQALIRAGVLQPGKVQSPGTFQLAGLILVVLGALLWRAA